MDLNHNGMKIETIDIVLKSVEDGIYEGVSTHVLTDKELDILLSYASALITLKADIKHAERICDDAYDLLNKLDIWQKKNKEI